MIKMNEYEQIRILYFNQKKSISEIKRIVNRDRKTIRKAIKGKEPRYELKEPKPKPVIGDFVKIIETWLKEDIKNAVPRKQRHTAARIHERLVEEHNYTGSDRTVRREVEIIKNRIGIGGVEEFVPSDPERRFGAEVDWGEAYIDLKGEKTKVYIFCLRLRRSGKCFVQAYPSANQECFFHGHIQAFIHLGGVPETITYDNLKSAVKKILKGRDRIEQESFQLFRSYYAFESIFCNAYKGSEKGGVEGNVGYSRRHFMTPIPKVEDLDELNKILLKRCMNHDLHITAGEAETIGALFEKEKNRLLELPAKPYQNYKLLTAKVGKFMTVTVKTNMYSVPSGYVGKKVNVELGLSEVRIVHQGKTIACHKRCLGRRQWVLDPWHYFSLLSHKTRAFDSSRVYSIMAEQWDPIFIDLWNQQKLAYGEYEGTKEFLETLLLFNKNNYEDMIIIFQLAIEENICSKEMIESTFHSLTENLNPSVKAEVKDMPNVCNFSIPDPDVNKFDLLLQR